MNTNKGLASKNFDIDFSIAAKLGYYVYALVDPVSNEVFYIGKGKGSRVLNHSKAVGLAIDPESAKRARSEKERKIKELRQRGLQYRWYVLAHSLPSEETAFLIESAVIFSLNNCRGQGLKLTNIVRGSFLDQHGGADQETVMSWRAPPPNPKRAYPNVLVFNISKALEERKSAYEATRAAWVGVPEKFRAAPDCLAVGLRGGYSECVIKIDPRSWKRTENNDGKRGTRWSFSGENFRSHDLLHKSWRSLLRNNGFWLRGNYLGVEFDGNGRFRITRGLKGSRLTKISST